MVTRTTLMLWRSVEVGSGSSERRRVGLPSKCKSVECCPFDGLPCEYVGSCDEVMALNFGFVLPCRCSRAVA